MTNSKPSGEQFFSKIINLIKVWIFLNPFGSVVYLVQKTHQNEIWCNCQHVYIYKLQYQQFSTVHSLKWPVLSLPWSPANSHLPPSVLVIYGGLWLHSISPGIVYYDKIQVTSSFREWKKILQRSSLQGNLLKGIGKKTVRREGIEPIKRVFKHVFSSHC